MRPRRHGSQPAEAFAGDRILVVHPYPQTEAATQLLGELAQALRRLLVGGLVDEVAGEHHSLGNGLGGVGGFQRLLRSVSDQSQLLGLHGLRVGAVLIETVLTQQEPLHHGPRCFLQVHLPEGGGHVRCLSHGSTEPAPGLPQPLPVDLGPQANQREGVEGDAT